MSSCSVHQWKSFSTLVQGLHHSSSQILISAYFINYTKAYPCTYTMIVDSGQWSTKFIKASYRNNRSQALDLSLHFHSNFGRLKFEARGCFLFCMDGRALPIQNRIDSDLLLYTNVFLSVLNRGNFVSQILYTFYRFVSSTLMTRKFSFHFSMLAMILNEQVYIAFPNINAVLAKPSSSFVALD